MCGIAGVVQAAGDAARLLGIAAREQAHRGPDACGTHLAQSGRWTVGLAHQRLSVIDVSAAANQPMRDPAGGEWITYNGEVYNYIELRADLEREGCRFSTASDTEVVLAALRQWGVEAACKRFNGMWAFAWYDAPRARLVFARDRLGVKPLNYCLEKNRLLFASEVKALLAMAERKFRINAQAAGEYLAQQLLETTDNTFFEGITKLTPGCYGVVDLTASGLSVEVKRYWDIPAAVPDVVNREGAIEEVRQLFLDAVRIRMRSDVPIGVLLSGGVDSSAIAAAMQHLLGRNAPINLLAAVSPGSRFDESPFIDAMANHLALPVHKVTLDFSPESAFRLLDEACRVNDAPVGSFSNVAHFLLMQKAKELGITVIMSGQGADELLGGYRRYLVFYALQMLRGGRYFSAASLLAGFLKNGTVISQFSMKDAKRYLPPRLRPREASILGPALAGFIPVPTGFARGMTVREYQALDLKRFSVPMLLHYEDRMSMALGREVRVPFLDYRLVERLAPMPPDMKLRNGWTKYIFRKAVEKMLPPEIVWRKDKQGFINPQPDWLKERLRPGVMEYFSPDALIFRHGLADRATVLEKYERYCRQPGETGIISFKDIFAPLALEAWARRYQPQISW